MIIKRQSIIVVLLFGIVAAATFYFWSSQPEADYGRKVLVFTKTQEYRHDSIPVGISVIERLAKKNRFNVVTSEDSSLFTDASLARFQAVFFLSTTGDVLNDEQQVAFERYIQAGGGFVGVHAASDTEWKMSADVRPWHWYQRLVGGVFNGHPTSSDQTGVLTVRDKTHLATNSLPDNWQVSDEWYDFKRVSAGIQVLMTVDEASYTGAKMGRGEHHPVAWYRDFDGGRSFYTALGHTESALNHPNFITLLEGGINYAMGDSVALDYTQSRPEPWRFSRVVLDSNLNEPLKLTFSPRGELYFIERRGNLRRYDFTRKQSVTVHTFDDLQTIYEYGLIGLAFDPNYIENNWVYLFRTIAKGEAGEHVLARFKLHNDVLDETSEQVLLRMPADGVPGKEGSHTGGDMQFDAEGNLWLSTGDDTKPADQAYLDDRPGKLQYDAARSAGNTQDLRGKILRITPLPNADANGRLYSIPDGNLFASAADGRPEIYVMGLRNPYTIAYNDRQQRIYWGEVGPDSSTTNERGSKGYDEVNFAEKPGNYGWPYVIGNNQPYAYYDYESKKVLGMVKPQAPENHSRNNTGSKALPPAKAAWIAYPYDETDELFELNSGGRNALVAPFYYSDEVDQSSEIKFPSFFNGKLIISDFIRRWLMLVNTDEQGQVESFMPIIDQPLNGPLDMAFGPDGALYIVEYGTNWFTGNIDSYISRIEYYGGDNPPPVAVAKAVKTVGAAPFTTRLDGSLSFDRNDSGSPMHYHWQLLENGKPVEVIGTEEQVELSIAEPGDYYVQLTVTDSGGQSSTNSLRFQIGNERPEVTITTSGNRSFYWEDQPLEYVVTVNDLEDGSTKDGRILADDVVIKYGYVSGGEDFAKVLAAQALNPVLAGKEIVTKGSDCHACHTTESKSVGPSFIEIAERYKNKKDADSYLRSVIAQGGSGKWSGGHAMPPHPDLSSEKLHHIVRYILSLVEESAIPKASMSLAGTLQFDQHQQDYIDGQIDKGISVDIGRFYQGRYLFNASYTDLGAPSAHVLQGQQTLILRPSKINVVEFDKTEGIVGIEIAEGLGAALLSSPPAHGVFNYGLVKNIDLTGIERIHVVVGGIKPILSGGPLELRLDSIDNEPIATANVDVTMIPNLEKSAVDLDVSQVNGVHDLYFGAPPIAGHDNGRLLYALVYFEFIRE